MSDPVEGLHYPASTGDFLARFRSDVDCLDYLCWLRWPDGFVCPTCDSTDGGWRLGDGRFMCSECGARSSVTAGTIFDRTRTSLTVWFHACWMFAAQKDGVPAQSLQRVLEIGSYQTAWAMLLPDPDIDVAEEVQPPVAAVDPVGGLPVEPRPPTDLVEG
jgi:hypothetical protein